MPPDVQTAPTELCEVRIATRVIELVIVFNGWDVQRMFFALSKVRAKFKCNDLFPNIHLWINRYRATTMLLARVIRALHSMRYTGV